MASNLKGIIVEIGGDTTNLQRALSKVNSATSSLSKELKGINSLLKLDPKNTELLSQKQVVLKENIEKVTSKLKSLNDVQDQVKKKWENYKKVEPQLTSLKNKIEETSNTLKKLQEKQEKATEAFKNGKISQEQYDNIKKSVEECKNTLSALKKEQKELSENTVTTEAYRDYQREIANTKIKLNDLKKTYNTFMLEQNKWNVNSKKVEEFGDKIVKVSSKIDNLGSKFTTRFSLPIIALGTLGTKSAMEQEASIQQVEKIYGEASDTIKEFANNTALSYNMSSKSAYKYSQIFGNLIQSMTDDQTKNAQYTQDLLKASSVIASATGRTMEDVMDRIRSGLLGNTEAIEDLGVNVNVSLLESTDAFKRFAGDKSWNQLDFQTQQQIRLFGILEQTTKKYGDEVNVNTTSKVQKLTSKLENMGSKLSSKLLPIVDKWIDKADKWIDRLDDMDDATLDNIIRIGLFVAAAGPVLKIFGKLGSAIGTVIKTTGQFSQAIAVVKTGTKSTSASVNSLASGIKGLISPFGIASVAIAASAAAITYAVKKSQEDVNKAFENMKNGASSFTEGIQSANSHLDSFNTTLFATTEEQKELQKNMDEVQKGITEICKRASDERREYTQEEIKQLDEYFNKLRELKNRELQIQQSISNAIVQQATQNAESFQGSLDEYRVQSQEWIKTAQDQKDKEIAIINDRTTQEIALLQQRYGDKANLDNAEYAREYDAIIQNKDNAIAQANEKVSRVNETYANGYAKRAEQENGFFSKLKETNVNVENENARHTAELDKINSAWYATEDMRRGAIEGENARHNQELKNQWKDLYKAMSDSEEEQMGTWIAMLADTELYGGQINNESKKIVDNVIASYDNMPNGTRKAMKNAMQPMLEEMEKSEPSLFAKATSIANGILNKLKQGFDIHSPSRKTRKIFKYAMQGGEIELDAGAKRMYSQVDEISKKLLNKFSGMSTDINLGNINKKIIENTQTVFTTPQIVFNVNELDEARLQQCFNYINRKFGTCY